MKHIAMHTSAHHKQAEGVDQTMKFGFWVYIMTDCVLFATLFAAFAVLRNNTAGGASLSEIVDLPYVMIETFALLTSSLTCGLAMLSAYAGKPKAVAGWLMATGVLGATFLALELSEFHHLIAEGSSFKASAFLSSYFTLVGTHGVHIIVGLIWLILLAAQVLRRGLPSTTLTRLTLFSMFWHFLDVIWIVIFTIVYLMGSL